MTTLSPYAPERDMLRDAQGNPLTRVAVGTLWVPAILRRKTSSIEFGPLEHKYRSVPVPADLLDRFVALGGDDHGVSTFAERFGPLGLFRVRQTGEVRPEPHRLGRSRHSERIVWWHRYRTEFELLLKLAAFAGERPGAEVTLADFEILEALKFDFPGVMTEEDENGTGEFENWAAWEGWLPTTRRTAAQSFLNNRVNTLLHQCGIRPVLTFGPRMSGVELVFKDLMFSDGSGEGHLSLFGALTMQLVAAVLGRGWAVCKGCQRVFSPTGHQSKYCSRPSCGRKAAVRDAKRRYRDTPLGRAAVKRQRAAAAKRRRFGADARAAKTK